MPGDESVGVALVVAGESVLPGISHFLKGDVGDGLRYGILGILARAKWGPVGLGLVVAGSTYKAVTGQHLVSQLGLGRALHTEPAASPAAAPVAKEAKA